MARSTRRCEPTARFRFRPTSTTPPRPRTSSATRRFTRGRTEPGRRRRRAATPRSAPLPRTTLLLLAAAFAGEERLREAYAHAVRERYRFYSYGDAMMVCGGDR